MAEQKTFMTGALTAHLGFTVTESLITALGFEPVGRDKRAVLWAQSDLPDICRKLGKYISNKADVPFNPAPPKKPVKGKAEASKPSSPPPADDDDEL